MGTLTRRSPKARLGMAENDFEVAFMYGAPYIHGLPWNPLDGGFPRFAILTLFNILS
jgi:hypothetical protein